MTAVSANGKPLQPGTERRNLSVSDTVTSSTAAPVFLHTGWRSGGTWLWSRFRADPRVVAYYEPLHEIVATLTADVLPSLRPEAWPSRHPTLTHPYFQEFAPLLSAETPGVDGFHRGFATQDFFADAAADLPELRAYIAMLLDHATAQAGQPVLKFCRSIGRVGWMQRNFPDVLHVVVLRNPATQFGSARAQYILQDNPYFLAMPLLILARNRGNPRVTEAMETIGATLPRLPAVDNDGAALAACRDHLRHAPPEDWYRGFLVFWTLAALGIPSCVDRIIDTDLLSQSASFRDASQRDLAGLTGVPLNLKEGRGKDTGTTPGDDAVRASTALGTPRAAVWRCHQAAIALMSAQRGADWADTKVGARISAMLAQANLIAMDGDAILRANTFDRITSRQVLLARAERAEQALDAVHASYSWKVTTPLRWLRTRLGASLDASVGR
jgi:hypothetical protein